MKGLWLRNMKKLIDANIIVRFLMNDHAEMAAEAKLIIESGAHTLPEVIAEVIHVLKGVYQVEKKDISSALVDLFDEVGIDHKQVMCYALHMYGETSLDFVDCILIARNHLLDEEIISFDKKLNKKLKSQNELT